MTWAAVDGRVFLLMLLAAFLLWLWARAVLTRHRRRDR